MEPARPGGVMPLRPLTFAELLDAAVALLRSNAAPLLGVAFVLAAAEQAMLFPLRQAAGMKPPGYLPYADRLGPFWLTFSTGLGTEAAILAVIGGFAATAAGPALLGQRLAGRAVLTGTLRRAGALLLLAGVVGLAVGLAALAGFLPWPLIYGMVGLVTPALVIDRLGPGRALVRGWTLGGRAGLRASWLRLGGYLSWLAIRIGLGFGAFGALVLIVPQSRAWLAVLSAITWLLIDTVAYATLACLDAVLYLETRMRTEGLDIALALARRRGGPIDLARRRGGPIDLARRRGGPIDLAPTR